MAGGTTNAFELVFGVKGVGVGGESYEEIRKGIETIAKNLVGKQELNLKFGVDAAALETSIKNALKGKTFNIDVSANVNGGGSGSGGSGKGGKPNSSIASLASLRSEIIKLETQAKNLPTSVASGHRKELDWLTARLQALRVEYQKGVGRYAKKNNTTSKDVKQQVSQQKNVVSATEKQERAITKQNDKYDEQKKKLKELIVQAQEYRKTLDDFAKDNQTRLRKDPNLGGAYSTASNGVDAFLSSAQYVVSNGRFSSTQGADQIFEAEQLAKAYGDAKKATDQLLSSEEKRSKQNDADTKKENNRLRGLHMLAEQAQELYQKLKDTGGETRAPALMKELSDLIEQGRNGSFGGGAGAGSVQEYKDTLNDIKLRANDAGLATENLGHKIARVFSEKIGYGVMAAAAAKLRQALSEIYQNVVKIDTAMTELKKVTSETDATYSKFLDGAAKRAEKLGAVLSDVISATADFARLGYSLEDASNLADVAIVYKNVGDGITSINDASESIISSMRAFGVEANNAMSIVDKYNEVGNTMPISSKGIGDALQKSASAMAAANNTLDETIALAAAANSVVQNPEIVGKVYAQQYSNVLKEDSYIG